MDDLISRQQTICALSMITMYKGSIPYGTAVMRIEQLPSAQPEIVRCKDCDWWTKQEDSPQGRCALLQMYPTGGWFCGNARRREVTE